MNLLRALPPGVIWLFISAALFIVNAAFLAAHGQQQLAELGFVGDALAIAIAVAFGGWTKPDKRGVR